MANNAYKWSKEYTSFHLEMNIRFRFKLIYK